ncbi:hypothetical protein LZ31DRAFT_627763 [Colletotrichum somersetense]|nr:hypothetical protein LZ31DRAFT_627763 [Colletotrichum somersetense]
MSSSLSVQQANVSCAKREQPLKQPDSHASRSKDNDPGILSPRRRRLGLRHSLSMRIHQPQYRGVFFQTTVVGIVAFTALGLWNAMNSVGAGGQQSPYLVMRRFAFGIVGYVVYSAALHVNNRYGGTEWFMYAGSAACGVTAGLFWAAEGAVMLSYPEPENRGK